MSRFDRLLRGHDEAGALLRGGQDLDVHDADLHNHSHITMPDRPHAHVHAHDGADHSHMHAHAAPNPYRSGDGGATASRIDREWTPVLQDLLELEAAGALGGIRAVITERLRQVRDNQEAGLSEWMIQLDLVAGSLARGAAWMAAEIDRQQADGTP